MEYPVNEISNYGIIGNGQTAALISQAGSIDWCCWPRFDSPAVFCRLLDTTLGGLCRLAPATAFTTTREYLPGTNVLRTTFQTDNGLAQLTDFMPAPENRPGRRDFPHRILRKLEVLEGEMEVEICLRPTFNYARTPAAWDILPDGAIATGNDEMLTLTTAIPLRQQRDSVGGRSRVVAGETQWLVLTHGPPTTAENALQIGRIQAETELQHTLQYWQDWSQNCQYQGPYRDLVVRSALVLKLLVFQPTGGLIAAPTTSLPADLGGGRNWDYRYTWLRDSGLVLDALQQLGYHEESMAFIDWLQDLCLCCSDELRIMYQVDGELVPREATLEHLSGYGDSRPVRIGNDAAAQTQIDVFGHVLDAVVLCFERMPRAIKPELWDFLRQITDHAAKTWHEADQGPWEIRGTPRHYLYSKLYCWVGLDRAVKFAQKHQLEGDLAAWQRERDALHAAILEQGFDSQVGAFTQAFDSRAIDATALALPLVDFLPPDDPRLVQTVQRVQENLGTDCGVYRYLEEDGLPGHDGAFLLCSFWLVMNLALQKRQAEARELFERLCSFANDLGLLSEQIDPKNKVLTGNFPQGFTHLGLIRAAMHLDASGETE